jgi:hypothetical protein
VHIKLCPAAAGLVNLYPVRTRIKLPNVCIETELLHPTSSWRFDRLSHRLHRELATNPESILTMPWVDANTCVSCHVMIGNKCAI